MGENERALRQRMPVVQAARGLPLAGPSIGRFLDDPAFRSISFARAGLAIDEFWAVGNIIVGVQSQTLWAITLGAYYACLAVMRAFLSHHERCSKQRSAARDLALCRRCGISIMVLAFPVTGIMLLNVRNMGTFSHPVQLTVGVAAYAFVKLGMGIASFVRYRSGDKPLMLAASNVSLAGALGTLLTMGILMLNVFTDERTGSGFRISMTVGMGVAVTVGVFVLGFVLVLRAGRLRTKEQVPDPSDSVV